MHILFSACYGGMRRRNRGCSGGFAGEPGCSPLNENTQNCVCNEDPCPEGPGK